jgi:hypothetical protein
VTEHADWDPIAHHASLMQLWSIQDNLLQWYRSIFVAVEGILFTAALVGLTSEMAWIALLPTFMGVVLLFEFKDLIKSRALAVTDVQRKLLQLEANGTCPPVVHEFKKMQRALNGPDAHESNRLEVDESLEALLEAGPTRKFFNLWVPIIFGLAWFAVLAWICYTYLPIIRHYI